jgi:Tol biopolymer transport system component/serine/threonine protein kinase
MIGRTLSHYQVLEKIGEGGMGEVYLAKDTKLDREVAIKVLPAAFSENKERLTRFEREAKAVAALDHPNIVTIYSVEEAEGVHFYTMQLVKGQTLTELIPKSGLPLNKFFEIAVPLTDAVSAAHEQGIVHRDLKPDNLMVGGDGRLKILDFGLAKLKPELSEAGASELPTQSATAEGRILGTVAYMSPEQAEGKTVDARSDIFSIGIILYEMATGESPFKGDTAASLLSSIIKDKPRSATEVNPSIPRELAKIIRRCLVKDPEHRYQNAKDIRNELEELKLDIDSGEVLGGVSATAAKPKSKWLLHTALVAVIVMAGIIAYQLRLGDVTDEATRYPIQGTLTQLTSQAGEELFPSLSPDGRFLAYASYAGDNSDVYVLRAGGARAINLTQDSPADDTQPAFSPDGEHIAFRSERDGGGIFIMGATGESVRRLTDTGCTPAWSPDGSEIVYATECNVATSQNRLSHSQLWIVNLANGGNRLINKMDSVQPSWSPNGHRIAYWSIDDTTGKRTGQRDIWTIPARGGEHVAVTQDAHTDWNPVWSPDGKFLYFASDRSGSMNLWRIPIDEESGRTLGLAEAVTAGASAFHKHLSFSSDGRRLAYVEWVETTNIWKAPFDLATHTVTGQPSQVTRGTRLAKHPDISPDGNWLTFDASGSGREDIFIIRTDGTGYLQLTNDLYRDRHPRWSPDGRKIAFYSNRSGSYDVWIIEPDGSGLEQLTETPGQSTNYAAWSPDGTLMASYNRSEGLSYIFDPNKPWQEQTPLQLPSLANGALSFGAYSWSPDGRAIAGPVNTDEGKHAGLAVYEPESNNYIKRFESGSLVAWLPDSSGLVFSASEISSGIRGLYLAESGSWQAKEILTLVPDTIICPKVSPDGRWLYFGRTAREADIWLLTLNEMQE